MNPDNDRKYFKVKKLNVLGILILVLTAGYLGWRLGHTEKFVVPQTNSTTLQQAAVNNDDDAQGVKSLVSYTLPDGWKEATCRNAPKPVYLIPNGSSPLDCDANPSAPVKISVDPGNNTDCNQLQNVQDVKKHVCISLFINGHKTLKASTEYLASSSYKKATTIDAYYLDTGNGVVKVEYIHGSDDQHKAGFEQLTNSIKAKP